MSIILKRWSGSRGPGFGHPMTGKHARCFALMMLFLQFADELNHFLFVRLHVEVELLRGFNNHINEPGEAAAAFAAFSHFVINLNGNNQLPRIGFQKASYSLPNFLFHKNVATADDHRSKPSETVKQT
ncbi:MAG: hypothetical protein AAF423_01415 [Pseudomonadota bacterium]